MTVSLTEEQSFVIDKVVNEMKNLVIAAMAGSGKTTTLLELARQFTTKYNCKSLLVTYNNPLRYGCCERIKKYNLQDKIDCQTYHSVTLKYFLDKENRTDFHDSLIHDALKVDKVKPGTDIDQIRLVLLDECQDQTTDLANLAIHILKQIQIASGVKPVLVLCGDGFQKIYGFRNTTIEYMMNPAKYFGPYVANDGIFETARLSICFRITSEIANWINENMNPRNLEPFLTKEQWMDIKDSILAWWGDGIRADPKKPPGEPVSYIQNRDWSCKNLATQIASLYETYKTPHDVTLLCLSGKSSKAPIWKLINELTERAKPQVINWACLFEQNTDVADPSAKQGKRVASTIHRWKGLENKVIVLFGFDGSAEKLYRNLFELFCVYYVGLTRPLQRLIVVQCSDKPFATIRARNQMNIQGVICRKNKVVKSLSTQQIATKTAMRYRSRGLTVEDMFGFVPFDKWLDQDALSTCHSLRLADPASEMKVWHPDLYMIQCVDPLTKENTIPLYRMAIEMAVQLWCQKDRCVAPSYSEMFGEKIPDAKVQDLKEVIDFILEMQNYKCKTLISEDQKDDEDGGGYDCKFDWFFLVKLANAYRTLSTGILCKWRQLQNFDKWVPVQHLQSLFEVSVDLLENILPFQHDVVTFHEKVQIPIYLQGSKMFLNGSVFLKTGNILIHLCFQSSGVSENQSCIAYATHCLHSLLQPEKEFRTYILSPQQGLVVKIFQKDQSMIPNEFQNKFIINSVMRKLSLPEAIIEFSLSSSFTKKRKQSEFIDSSFQTKSKKQAKSTRSRKKDKEELLYPRKISKESPFYKFLIQKK